LKETSEIHEFLGHGLPEAPERVARSERVARQIAEYIVEQNLPEGTLLLRERDMQKLLQVARTTLREALRLLETRGVITIKPGRSGGPIVRRPKAADLSEAMSLVLSFEPVSLKQVLSARLIFEPTLARLAARNISRKQLRELRLWLEALQEHGPDPAVIHQPNSLIRRIVAEAASNPVLRIIYDTLQAITAAAVVGTQSTKRRATQVMASHWRLFDALQAHDEDRAEAEMRNQMGSSIRWWRAKYPALFDAKVRWNSTRKIANEFSPAATRAHGGAKHLGHGAMGDGGPSVRSTSAAKTSLIRVDHE